MQELKFEDFDDIVVSTKTFIAMTNIHINLFQMVNILPLSTYVMASKKRGRKKKSNVVSMNEHLKPGSIITVKYKGRIKGVDLKQKKHKKNAPWFRNSCTIVMVIDDKMINFKVCMNGMFQITGCKTDNHAKECVKYIWDYIRDTTDNIYNFYYDDHFQAIIIPAMRNIDFSLGFIVDREKLAKYMSQQTKFHSLLETSFGYTGVNIKIPIFKNIIESELQKIVFREEGWIETIIPYSEYLDRLCPKMREKKLTKRRYNTFLVFHSGKVIMSGLTSEFMRETYYYFLDIIKECWTQIQEQLN
jgi:TATA-box binding protein (TBP) (component of TFIID and TFIIIB)